LDLLKDFNADPALNDVLESDAFLRTINKEIEGSKVAPRRHVQSFKYERPNKMNDDERAVEALKEDSRLESVLLASAKNRLRKEKSQNYSMNLLGSGIPMIDIDEEKDEDLNSSDDDSLDEGYGGANPDDDFFQMGSNKFS